VSLRVPDGSTAVTGYDRPTCRKDIPHMAFEWLEDLSRNLSAVIAAVDTWPAYVLAHRYALDTLDRLRFERRTVQHAVTPQQFVNANSLDVRYEHVGRGESNLEVAAVSIRPSASPASDTRLED
jgi:hypothetical protein